MMTKDKIEKIVKSKGQNTRLCIITSRHYDSSLAYFLFLFKIAKEDFPELTHEQCGIKRYTGRFRKGFCGLEFQVISETMPEGYEEYPDNIITTHFPT